MPDQTGLAQHAEVVGGGGLADRDAEITALDVAVRGFELGTPALNLRTYTMHEIGRDPGWLRRAAAFIDSGL